MSQPSLYPKHLKTLAIAAVVFSATWIFSNTAQSEEAVLTFSGQVTGATCWLKIVDSTNATPSYGSGLIASNVAQRAITIPNASTSSQAQATPFGQEITITLSLQTNATSAATCNLAGQSTWNAVFDLSAGQVGSGSGKSWIVNSATTNAATNTGLFFKQGGSGTAEISGLVVEQGANGTKIGPSTNVTASTPILFRAQLVTTTASAAIPGAFSAKVPLMVVYQ